MILYIVILTSELRKNQIFVGDEAKTSSAVVGRRSRLVLVFQDLVFGVQTRHLNQQPGVKKEEHGRRKIRSYFL
ncbi:hypothetical protein RRG08_044147 [Elysia crispata]|uniref:Uncharacterized protein n=1 Tax=Elysia crispata TaxID=231223 RepID=A0AAE1DBB1_9GAST|nr:hypothetical protein RRG08_044147 [Elysia crispata]